MSSADMYSTIDGVLARCCNVDHFDRNLLYHKSSPAGLGLCVC
jgi:hypothetical protein